MSYLFVHFKEKYTEDGEQIYFALSKDGYIWEAVKNGNPVLTATKGDMGVRDITITRTSNNEFIIMATDLALARNINTKYGGNIRNAFRYGSKAIAMWKSKDLINWTEEILLEPGDSALGCFWAPGIFYDDVSGEYIIHWSSSTSEDDYSGLAIYYSRTKNFENFSEPKLFYKKQDSELLDSFIYKSNNTYHFFVKSAKNPKAVIHETSSSLLGPYIRDTNFDEQMSTIENCGAYEAPMVYKLSDGKICLMLDFYGCERKEDMGYVPFLMDSLDDVKLNMAKDKFVFPYGFKHGVVMEITDAEYETIKKSNRRDAVERKLREETEVNISAQKKYERPEPT